jgi:hypothetical protein
MAAGDTAQKRIMILMRSNVPQRYRWEAAHIAVIGGLITAGTLVTHLTAPTQPAAPARPVVAYRPPPPASHPSDPREVIIGPYSISGKFTLLGVDRKRSTSTTDQLTLHLRVVSRAMADLVTPFQSVMLEVRSQGLEPINPQHAFSHPIPAGQSRDEDIVFMIPSSLSLDHTVLRIHYYPDEREIPLRLLSHVDPGKSLP